MLNFVLSLLFGGCCSNVVSLEYIFQIVPKSSTIITLAQFVLIAACSYMLLRLTPKEPSVDGDKTKASETAEIPRYTWIAMVLLFFSTSLINNRALEYNISVALHIIFKSSSLLVNMLVGSVVLKKRYSWLQIGSVLLVTVGVILASWSSTSGKASSQGTLKPATTEELWTMIFGIGLMSVALLLSSVLGLYQEWVYATYGKNSWKEGLFYTHFYGLPFFALVSSDIKREFNTIVSETSRSGNLSSLWILLSINAVTQLMCIASVHKLSSMVSSLSLNLYLTFRKFLSLVLSILMFGASALTAQFVGGSILVALGSFIYIFASQSPPKTSPEKKDT